MSSINTSNAQAFDAEDFNDLLIKSEEIADPIPNFPAELKSLPVWLLWRKEERDGKTTKVPYNVMGRRANDPAQGVTFDVAVANLRGYAGLGVYVSGDVLAIDLDNCIDVNKPSLDPEVVETLKQLNSYTEVSQSGKGLHIFVRGVKPGAKCRVKGVELYDSKSTRFIAVTGRRVDGVSPDIEARDITWLYEKSFGEQTESAPANTEVTPVPPRTTRNNLVHHHGALTNELTLLMTGDFTENSIPFTVADEGEQNSVTFDSQSEAIASLLFYLAVKHDGDAEKMEAEFLSSALYQGISKWNAPGGKWDRLGKSELSSAIRKYQASKPVTQNVAAQVTDADASDWHSKFRAVGQLQSGGTRMLIDNFLPEGISMLGALSGTGKTFFALSICKALTTGKSLLGQFTVPEIVPVLYLIPELSGPSFRVRCEKFGIPDNENLFLCRTISEGVTLQMDDVAVIAAVKELRPFVVLDTSVRFNKSEDENSASANRVFVNDSLALRAAGARGVLGIHHSKKSIKKEGYSLETALRGTGDLGAMAQAVYGLRRNDVLYEDGAGPLMIEVLCLKAPDFTAPKPFTIAATVKQGEEIVSCIDTMGDFLPIEAGVASQELSSEFVRLVDAHPGYSLAKVAEALGISKRKVQSIAEKLKVRKEKSGWIFGNVKTGVSPDPKASEEIAT